MEVFDTVTKFLTLTGVGIGLWQYKKNWEREFSKKAYEACFGIYCQIMELLPLFTEYPAHSEEYQTAKKSFLRLVRGKSLLVISRSVENSIADFLQIQEAYEKSPKPINRNRLQNAAYELGHSLRNDLAKVWGIQFFERKDFYNALNPSDKKEDPFPHY